MKKSIAVISVALMSTVLFTACVPINYTRSITVHKDANGNITGTDEYEGITEAHQEGPKVQEVKGPATFKYLK